MNFELELISNIAKWVGRALQGPKELLLHVKLASLTVSQVLASYIHEGIATDFNTLKDIQIQKVQGEADKITAEAQIASNEATLHQRRDKIARLEKEKQQAELDKIKAETEKTKAEADAIRMDAETRRHQAEREMQVEEIRLAKIRLENALSKLRQEGGDLILSSDNLKANIEQSKKQEHGDKKLLLDEEVQSKLSKRSRAT